MIIKSIKLDNFGKFNNNVVTFSDGINILYGENEAGKTTLHTFIKAMLFGLDGKHGHLQDGNEYEKYIPWENSSVYKGSMVIETRGEEYRIERNFLKSEKSCTFTHIATGRELTKDEIEELFYGFDESCYYNTISISQLGSITNNELEKVLKNYASNLGSTKTTEINIEEALNELEDTKEKLILEAGADKKEEVEEEITKLQAEIKRNELEEEDIVAGIEQNREKINKLKARVKALEELDNVQTERQIKRNIHQENLLQRNEMITADIERLTKDKDKAEAHVKELKDYLEKYGVTNKQEVEREIEWLLTKSNFSIVCLLGVLFCVALGVVLFVLDPVFVLSDYTTWIQEAACIFGAIIFIVLFIVMFFVKKNKKEKKIELLKDLKISVDKYQAAISECSYADRQLKAKQKELNSVSYKLKAEEDTPAEMSDYNTEITQIKGQITEIRDTTSKSQWLLEQRKEALLKLRKQMEILEEKLEKIKAVEVDLAAVEEAKQGILAISEEIRRSFGQTLNQKASKYMAKITNGKYDTITIDDNMDIMVENRVGRDIPVDKLSKGTIEQIYMALRLAAADIIFEDDSKPILLDDAFVMYDNKRMANTMKFMANSLEQVIIFSCHTREKVMADKLELKYNLLVIQ